MTSYFLGVIINKKPHHERSLIALENLKITLAAARVNAGLTQVDVVKALDISNYRLTAWENGASEPTISEAEALCKLYGLSYDQIKWH